MRDVLNGEGNLKENEDALPNKNSNEGQHNGKSDLLQRRKDDGEEGAKDDEEEKDDFRRAKRKKHFPLNIKIHISGQEKTISLEAQSNFKVKNLKLMI